MKLQVRKARKYWYYRVISNNGQVLVTSETYLSKGNAKRAATDFRRWFCNKQPIVEVSTGDA